MLKNLLMVMVCLMISLAANAEKLTLGDTPPNYLGRDSNGDDVNLSDHQGKVVIISFWASWCSPCLKS